MFRYPNLKLYRKFLILAVLLGGLFIAASTHKAGASTAPCCSFCDNTYDTCTTGCDNGNGPSFDKCMLNCLNAYSHCFSGPPHCNDSC
jgi:hypothetical protein